MQQPPFIFQKEAPAIVCMTFFARFKSVLKQSKIAETIMRAVPAAVHTPRLNRWRNIGQPVLPYHYLQPLPVVVREARQR